MNDGEIVRSYAGMQVNMRRTAERVAHETLIKERLLRITPDEASRVQSSFLDAIKPFVDMKVGVMLRNVPPRFVEKVSGDVYRLVGAPAWDDISWLPEGERVIMEGAERVIAQIEEHFRKTYGYVEVRPRDDEPVKVGQLFHPGMMIT